MLEKNILWTFWMFVVTITCDVKINLNVCESYCVKLKCQWTSSIGKVFNFFTFSHMADAPSPCQMRPLASKVPHTATYPHYTFPTIGLNPSTWTNIPTYQHPCQIHPHIYMCVCLWVSPVSVFKCVYVLIVWVCGVVLVSIKVICCQIPYPPSKTYLTNLL